MRLRIFALCDKMSATDQANKQRRASMLARHIANKKKPCALCLRKVGFGLPRTAKRLQVGKATVYRWYKAEGIITDPRRNGVALKGRKALRRLVACMFALERQRALRLKQLRDAMMRVMRKEALTPSQTKGMTDAEAFKWRYYNVPEQRIYELCRRRMKRVLHGVKKAGKSLELVGCTTKHLRAHIESQFKRGMSWQNAGTGEGKWHIDHRIPCAAFDLTREDQQRICFHWTNLRPMWSLDNIRKGKRMEAHMTPCLPM